VQPKEHYSVDGNESLAGSAAVCKASSLLTYEVKAWGWGGDTVKLTCNGVTHQNMNQWLFISVFLQYE